MEKKNSKVITYALIGTLVLAAAFWAYWTFSGSGQVPEAVGVTVTSGNSLSAIDAQSNQEDPFVQVLQNIEQVTLQEKSLLSNKIFKENLQDFGKPIPDQPKGRNNPFAPIGAGSVFSTGNTNSSTSTTSTTNNSSTGGTGASNGTTQGGTNPLDSLAM